MKLIDTHCHIDIKHHFPDYEEVLARARKAGVAGLVLAGVTSDGWPRLFRLCRQHADLYPAPGLHPMYLAQHTPDDLVALQRIVATEEVTAIGEIGLDYYCTDLCRPTQQELFEQQIDIAGAAGLPLLLHVRKAHDRVLATLRRKKFQYGGIVHAFSGSLQQAMQFIKLGFKIGICATVTYSRAKKIRRVAAELPLTSLVLETDSPDIPPFHRYGTRNMPEYLPEVLEGLANIRSESITRIAAETTGNARRVLRLA